VTAPDLDENGEIMPQEEVWDSDDDQQVLKIKRQWGDKKFKAFCRILS
jgi:hypothetical protein